jgi:hypothetical protein
MLGMSNALNFILLSIDLVVVLASMVTWSVILRSISLITFSNYDVSDRLWV